MSNLKGGKHGNERLSNEFKKYGCGSFYFVILERCPVELLDDRESFWVDYYQSTNPEYGYNINGGGRKNYSITDATRKKYSDSHIGNKPSKSTRNKMSNARKGKKISEQAKKKISESNKGQTWSRGKKMSGRGSSKYVGVSWSKQYNKWRAYTLS